MKILRMTADHVPQVAELEALCFSDPWSEHSVSTELTNPLSLWLVLIHADVVAGYVGTQTVMGETDMMNIAIHPDYRRRGYADALLKALEQELKTAGSHCLSLEVRASNASALALYEKNGFREVGCRKNYYRHPKEDALILRKEWEL